MIDYSDLLERLRRLRSVPMSHGSFVTGITHRMVSAEYTLPINPDGPEAATAIETLTRELAKITTCLQHESALTNARDTEIAELHADLTATKARLAEAVKVIKSVEIARMSDAPKHWERATKLTDTFLAKQEARHG